MIVNPGAFRSPSSAVSLGRALGLIAVVTMIPATGFAMVVPPEWAPPPPEPAAPTRHHEPPTVPDGIVLWDRLAELGAEYEAPMPGLTTIKVVFSDAIEVLDGEETTFKGFMYPLEGGERHTRFLLSAFPANCPFCLPAGPAQLIEVLSREPVAFTYEPLAVAGRFELLRDDPSGLYYRLHDARAISE